MPGSPFAFALTLTLGIFTGANAVSQTPTLKDHSAAFRGVRNSPLSRRVKELLREPGVLRAHWGIAVTTLEGVPVLGIDEGKLFRPASTAKLFTTAAAFALLGPDTRFATRVYGDLDSSTGTVRGDLLLLGGGDPSFGTNDLPYHREDSSHPQTPEAAGEDSLARLADKLVEAGVKRVAGQVVGSDVLFGPAAPPAGWAAEDLLWGYGTLPSALSMNDNQLRVTVEPSTGAAGDLHAVGDESITSVDQLFPYLRVTNDVRIVQGEKSLIDAQEAPGTPQAVRVYGRMAPGAPAVMEHIALRDPALYAAGALRALLIQRGTTISADTQALHRSPPSEPVPFLEDLRTPGCEASLWGEGPACNSPCPEVAPVTRPLAEHLSHTLAEDVTFTLKTSANLHAEVLLHHLGLKASCSGGTTLGGARVLRAWLLHNGLGDGDFVLYDGSGLSAKDLVTPRAEAQLLAYAAAQPWSSQWIAALPVGGVDGTLSSRFTDPPLKEHVFAKTGTLGETRSLAGYVQCASGKRMIFSILVDNHEPGSTADRVVMDEIVSAIAKFN